MTEYKREGNLLWPTLLDHVTPDMRIAWEEPFGPVLPIIRVDSIEQAVEHCNKNNVALQGCVFTQDINRAIAISDSMETGTVQVHAKESAGGQQAPFFPGMKPLMLISVLVPRSKKYLRLPQCDHDQLLCRSMPLQHEVRTTSPSRASGTAASAARASQTRWR